MAPTIQTYFFYLLLTTAFVLSCSDKSEKTDSNVDTVTDTAQVADTESETELSTTPGSDGDTVADTDTDADTDTGTPADPDTGSVINADTVSETKADTNTDTDTPASVEPDSVSDSEADSDVNCPSPPATETGYLWFSGYEDDPWDESWGLEWQALENHEVTTNGVLFGSHAARVTYPEGTYSSEGGAQYKMAFAGLEPPLSVVDEMYVRYYLKFDETVDFVQGGKLPGLLGGEGNTGGDPPDGFDGWSARIMWRANGRIVQYVYHPDQDGTYAEDMDWNEGGGSRYFIPGQWHCVETYIKMNTVNGDGETGASYDGIVRSWLDGELALDRTDVRFRYTNSFGIDGFYFSTFFGGSDAEWAPVKDEHAMFDNFVLSDHPIGCLDPCMIPAATPSGPTAISVIRSTLVYNGETDAWNTGNWNNNGTYDYQSTENHTEAGSHSAYIEFDSAAWDATIFTAAEPFNPTDYTHLRMWIRPVGKGVRFRVQLRGESTNNSADVVVDGSPTFHANTWQPNTWQAVIIPIAAFESENGQQQLLVRSDTNTSTDAFWIDDVEFVVAE